MHAQNPNLLYVNEPPGSFASMCLSWSHQMDGTYSRSPTWQVCLGWCHHATFKTLIARPVSLNPLLLCVNWAWRGTLSFLISTTSSSASFALALSKAILGVRYVSGELIWAFRMYLRSTSPSYLLCSHHVSVPLTHTVSVSRVQAFLMYVGLFLR